MKPSIRYLHLPMWCPHVSGGLRRAAVCMSPARFPRGARWICSILDEGLRQWWDGVTSSSLWLNNLKTESSGAHLVQTLLRLVFGLPRQTSATLQGLPLYEDLPAVPKPVIFLDTLFSSDTQAPVMTQCILMNRVRPRHSGWPSRPG